jgi:hypothetical protein
MPITSLSNAPPYAALASRCIRPNMLPSVSKQ